MPDFHLDVTSTAEANLRDLPDDDEQAVRSFCADILRFRSNPGHSKDSVVIDPKLGLFRTHVNSGTPLSSTVAEGMAPGTVYQVVYQIDKKASTVRIATVMSLAEAREMERKSLDL